MLHKTPKSAFWKYIKGGAKTLFIIEAVAFAVSYGVYHRMNTNREFRSYVQENCPYALDYYYKIGGLGYGLLRLTEPSAEKLQRIRDSASSAHLTEGEQKKILFMKRLREAATDPTPIYLQKKKSD